MKLKFLTTLPFTICLVGQTVSPKASTLQREKKSESSSLDSKVNNLDSRVSALEFWNQVSRGADPAIVSVDADTIVYAKDENGLLFPLKLKRTQTIPGVGVRYVFSVINIYSVTFKNVNLQIMPIMIKNVSEDKSATGNLDPGPQKTANFLGELLPGSECEVALTMTQDELQRPIKSFSVMISVSILEWRSIN